MGENSNKFRNLNFHKMNNFCFIKPRWQHCSIVCWCERFCRIFWIFHRSIQICHWWMVSFNCSLHLSGLFHGNQIHVSFLEQNQFEPCKDWSRRLWSCFINISFCFSYRFLYMEMFFNFPEWRFHTIAWLVPWWESDRFEPCLTRVSLPLFHSCKLMANWTWVH